MYRIMVIGETWGEKEEELGKPFVGPAGWLLNSMLRQVGLNRDDLYLTNVFNVRPPNANDITNLCGTKAEGIPGFPALVKGKFALAKYAPEIERLYNEIRAVSPTLIIALGATAIWALKIGSGIKKHRGYPHLTYVSGTPIKVLPTYHPAAIMREYSLRVIGLSDLSKAVEEAQFPEIRRTQRFIHIQPSIKDLFDFEAEFIDTSDELSIDIETANRQITCIGFAPSTNRALVVPFIQSGNQSYWPSSFEEAEALRWVARQCKKPKSTVVGQNFLYDINYLWSKYGIPVPYFSDDTMLLHHALQPELEKGLNFLGSVYTKEPSWKFMRHSTTTLKKEE